MKDQNQPKLDNLLNADTSLDGESTEKSKEMIEIKLRIRVTPCREEKRQEKIDRWPQNYWLGVDYTGISHENVFYRRYNV